MNRLVASTCALVLGCLNEADYCLTAKCHQLLEVLIGEFGLVVSYYHLVSFESG